MLDKCVTFNPSTKIFDKENLTLMNENIAFNCRKLRRGGLIFACFTGDGIVHIKKSFSCKPFKIHHMKILYEEFPEFSFNNASRDECPQI